VGDEDWFGALEMRVAGHHCFVHVIRLFYQRVDACDKRIKRERDFLANVESEIGGDLFVAAAAGVELEAKRPTRSTRASSTKWWMSSAKGDCVRGLACFRCVIGGDGIKRCADLRSFILCQDSSGDESGRVALLAATS